jgi:hypothetical protein
MSRTPQQAVVPAEHPSYDATTDTFIMGHGDEPPDFSARVSPTATREQPLAKARPDEERRGPKRRRRAA